MTLTGKAVGRCRGAEPNCSCCGVTNKNSAAQSLPLRGALSLHLVQRILFYSPVNRFHWSFDSRWILLTLMWLILLRLVIVLAWEKKRCQHAHATRLCVERRATEQHSNPLRTRGVMAGVRDSLEEGVGRLHFEDLSARVCWGLGMHLPSKSLSCPSSWHPAVNAWAKGSRLLKCVSLPSLRERWDLSTHLIQMTWFNLSLLHITFLGHLATSIFHFVPGWVQACNVCVPFLFHRIK